MDKQRVLFSLLKIALQVEPSHGASVAEDFKTILSAILKEEPSKETSKKEETMSEFIQQNITEQFMGRSPSLIIHPVPHEQPRYVPQLVPQVEPILRAKLAPRADLFSVFKFSDSSEDDVHSLYSIKSVLTDEDIGSKKDNTPAVHVVKAPTAASPCEAGEGSSNIAAIDINNADENVEDIEDVEDVEDIEDAEEEEEEDTEFEEFPLKDGIHYKDPITNIVYKEMEGIHRVGVFNPDTNKFKRDTK